MPSRNAVIQASQENAQDHQFRKFAIDITKHLQFTLVCFGRK